MPRLNTATKRGRRALTDEELMSLVARGDARAFELIFDRHASAALSLAYRICRRTAVAEDVVQEAFLSLWRSGSCYDPARGSVRSWVLTVVHHRAIDAIRRISVNQRHDASDDRIAERIPAAELTDAEVVRRDEARRVRGALEQLPAEQRQVIELAYFDGLTHTQIAQLLGLPEGTAKGRMRLGLHKLRVLLASDAGADRRSTAPTQIYVARGRRRADHQRPGRPRADDLPSGEERPRGDPIEVTEINNFSLGTGEQQPTERLPAAGTRATPANTTAAAGDQASSSPATSILPHANSTHLHPLDVRRRAG